MPDELARLAFAYWARGFILEREKPTHSSLISSPHSSLWIIYLMPNWPAKQGYLPVFQIPVLSRLQYCIEKAIYFPVPNVVPVPLHAFFEYLIAPP